MLTSLKVTNYRSFKEYSLNNLARVNLLVGENNCGKTSLLEAIRLLATSGNQQTIRIISILRGESTPSHNGNGKTMVFPLSAYARHLFYGHSYDPGNSLEIEGASMGRLRLSVEELTESEPPGEAQISMMEDFDLDKGNLALRIEKLDVESPKNYQVGEYGKVTMSLDDFAREKTKRKESAPLFYVGARAFPPQTFVDLWDAVIREKREADVTEPMRTLEPDLESIAFLVGDRDKSPDSRSGIVVGLKGKPERVPLGSLGDGAYRLFQLALTSSRCQGGTLLVDEIDTGLHYSIMGTVWRMLVKTAMDLDVNVFATTHSYDCIRGLAWLCENHPDLGEQVSLHRIDRLRNHSIALRGKEIPQTVVKHQVEVR